MKLLKLGSMHPFFSLMGIYATLKSFSIAQKYFPETHANNGVGNSFRHSLWTCLILMYCCKISSPRKSLDYCKKMTNLHEELFPNKPLEKKMDLHNNEIGMQFFMSLLPGIHRQFFETGFFVEELIKKTKSAKKLRNIEEKHEGYLIYLQE